MFNHLGFLMPIPAAFMHPQSPAGSFTFVDPLVIPTSRVTATSPVTATSRVTAKPRVAGESSDEKSEDVSASAEPTERKLDDIARNVWVAADSAESQISPIHKQLLDVKTQLNKWLNGPDDNDPLDMLSISKIGKDALASVYNTNSIAVETHIKEVNSSISRLAGFLTEIKLIKKRVSRSAPTSSHPRGHSRTDSIISNSTEVFSNAIAAGEIAKIVIENANRAQADAIGREPRVFDYEDEENKAVGK